MYGLVNKAIEDFVTQRFGVEIWERILEKAGLDGEVFISMKSYPDDWTYKLVGAGSEVLGLPADDVLTAFGEHWIGFMQRAGYGQHLKACGRTLPDFLRRLDNMHAHIGLTFADSKMPSFRCTEIAGQRLQVDYYSARSGLTPMVVGLLRGLGAFFGVAVQVEIAQSRALGADHDQFQGIVFQ